MLCGSSTSDTVDRLGANIPTARLLPAEPQPNKPLWPTAIDHNSPPRQTNNLSRAAHLCMSSASCPPVVLGFASAGCLQLKCRVQLCTNILISFLDFLLLGWRPVTVLDANTKSLLLALLGSCTVGDCQLLSLRSRSCAGPPCLQSSVHIKLQPQMPSGLPGSAKAKVPRLQIIVYVRHTTLPHLNWLLRWNASPCSQLCSSALLALLLG